MKTKAELFFRSLKGKTIGFVGLGVSHTETIKLFAREGLRVVVLDKDTPNAFPPELLEELDQLGVVLELGTDDIFGCTQELDVVFRTPGLFYFTPSLTEFRKQGGIVTSEMEVFFQLCPCPTFGISGSDGKTTTTTLISEMLKEEGKTVHLGGNIGQALLPLIHQIEPDHVAVVELSSFQLLSMRSAPTVSVLTNIAPNHLDVHTDYQEYVEAKKHLFLHQDAFSRTVLGVDNDLVAQFAPLVRGELSCFSLDSSRAIFQGAQLKDDVLNLITKGKEKPILKPEELKLPGRHNILNTLAAFAALDGWVSTHAMHKVASTFSGVEHRLELTRTRNGVRWYNDSISSSPTRALSAIATFPDNLVLIAGGYDKKIPYDPLAPEIIKHVRVLILMGQTGPKIGQIVKNHPDYKEGAPLILYAENMEQGVALGDKHSKTGDAVILSPASASFDLYKNFTFRGRHFKELVALLP